MLGSIRRAPSVVGTDRKPARMPIAPPIVSALPAASSAGGADEARTDSASRRGSDFAVLCRKVRAAGLLERRPASYLARIGATVGAYAAVWAVFVWLGHSWLQLITAGALGLVFTQVAFLGHDGGHQQIVRGRRGNDLLSMFAGNLLVGLSFGWWVDKHNRHHAHPNHEGHDPDIGDGVLAFTTEQIGARHAGLGRFIGAHQAFLFFPLLTLEGLNLHVASGRFLLGRRGDRAGRYRRLELSLLAVHCLAYLGGLFVVLGPVKGIAFFAVHQAVFGLYMGCSFAPNHKGMPTIAADQTVDYLRRQVLTSRNIRGGWLIDELLGGLNYQIEHHLFPNLPRANLRAARLLVRAHCADQAIGYTETSLAGSYAIVLRHLHALGAPLRAAGTALA
jgi:fatty acid desaturase